MKQYLIVLFSILFFGFNPVFAQHNQDIIIGSTFSIHSGILDEERTCLLSLPDSYDTMSSTQYPVLILLDGYSFFKTAAGIVHFMSSDRNRNYFMPETIIVAIENVDRERDLTVTKIKTKRPNTMGGGRHFLEFIEQELIPYVDENYRTEPYRVLVGHSLGGLLAFNAYRMPNSFFDAYISIDPSIWWDEEMMTDKVDSIQPSSFNKRLYIATANQGEAKQGRNKKRHNALYALMEDRAVGSFNVKIEYFENESHRSVPLIALYEGLRYIFNVEDK